ncbi:putative copia-like retroelement [Panicum miliaceum]|uniref:Copia-like retroelement n=1 Tax=Panicum miliaceum TaxID=4540 RepID=A0A3L6QK96_PANMI|nr:putative copia-like retroelement [Panicum miliaceum]
MTAKARNEREKNPFNIRKGRSVEYRFQTKFHQDFYESAILSKKYKVARSQYVDWQKYEDMEDPIFDEIIDACKKKHVYKIMGFKYDWNNEIIAQFYATYYFEKDVHVRWVHWMIEGKWYKINYFEFAAMFGFGKSDHGRNRIHNWSHLSEEDMKDMYFPGREWEYGGPKGLIPFCGYLN